MLCPFCAEADTKVVDSRPLKDRSAVIRRRRRCLSCGEAFRTDEALTTETFKVKKQDGSTQDYVRSKIVKAIEKAAWSYNKSPGRGRLAPADVNAIVERVENQIKARSARLVPTTEIGRIVLQELTDGTLAGEVVRARFAIVFQSRTAGLSGFRGLKGFVNWLHDVYGTSRIEKPAVTPCVVRKRDGQDEPFRQTALESSIGIVAKGSGTDREVYRYAERLAAKVREELRYQSIVTTQQIAAEVLKCFLHERDALSYLRYASAVKRYRSIDDFWLETYGLDADGDIM